MGRDRIDPEGGRRLPPIDKWGEAADVKSSLESVRESVDKLASIASQSNIKPYGSGKLGSISKWGEAVDTSSPSSKFVSPFSGNYGEQLANNSVKAGMSSRGGAYSRAERISSSARERAVEALRLADEADRLGKQQRRSSQESRAARGFANEASKARNVAEANFIFSREGSPEYAIAKQAFENAKTKEAEAKLAADEKFSIAKNFRAQHSSSSYRAAQGFNQASVSEAGYGGRGSGRSNSSGGSGYDSNDEDDDESSGGNKRWGRVRRRLRRKRERREERAAKIAEKTASNQQSNIEKWNKQNQRKTSDAFKDLRQRTARNQRQKEKEDRIARQEKNQASRATASWTRSQQRKTSDAFKRVQQGRNRDQRKKEKQDRANRLKKVAQFVAGATAAHQVASGNFMGAARTAAWGSGNPVAIAAEEFTSFLMTASQALGNFAEQTLNANKGLASYSGRIAGAYGSYELGESRRSFSMARGTEESGSELIKAMNNMRDSWMQYNIASGNLSNRTSTLIAGGSAGFGEEAGHALVALNSTLESILDLLGGLTGLSTESFGKALGKGIFDVVVLGPVLKPIVELLKLIVPEKKTTIGDRGPMAEFAGRMMIPGPVPTVRRPVPPFRRMR